MKVSLIIPTWQAEKQLETLLYRLARQTVQEKEVIIIDSSSSDRTVQIAQGHVDQVIIIPQERFDHGGTRNQAVREANGEILVFLTQDALPKDAFFLENLLAPLQEERAVASYGRQVARSVASPVEKFARCFNYPAYDMIKGKEDIERLGIKTFFFTNVCSAVRREFFEAVGKFPEKIILNEDMILAAKLILAGHKIAYCAQAMVYHSHHYTYGQQLQRNFDIGVSLRMHDWILAYARAESEGWRYLQEQVRFLCQERAYAQLVNCFLDTCARYVGYKLGLHYRFLPSWLQKKCSMHRFFWE